MAKITRSKKTSVGRVLTGFLCLSFTPTVNFTGFLYLNTELARVLEEFQFLGAFGACVMTSMAADSVFGVAQTVQAGKVTKSPALSLELLLFNS